MTRIICFIPSITETLIDCDLEVVGRTRFCIHPIKKIIEIPTVGGTKDVKWDKVKALSPDLIILDKEENTLEMAEACPFPFFVLHITGVDNIAVELQRLAQHLNNKKLSDIADRWRKLSFLTPKSIASIDKIPGVIKYLNEKQTHTITKIEYMIWKDPWMCIGPDTFIWSVLVKLGLEDYLIIRPDKYPNLGDKLPATENCFYLFSSEPFPFEKHLSELNEMDFKGAVVDGELFSWYGTRSLLFLEKELLS
jgi:ABC-type Fe3+-hydroxamate transport system substrate-binding protein